MDLKPDAMEENSPGISCSLFRSMVFAMSLLRSVDSGDDPSRQDLDSRVALHRPEFYNRILAM